MPGRGRADRYPAVVAGPEHPAQQRSGEPAAQPGRRRRAIVVLGKDRAGHLEHGVHRIHVDQLAGRAVSQPVIAGRQHAERPDVASDGVAQRDRGEDRRPVGRPGHVRESGECLAERSAARPAAVRPVEAVGGHVDIDQAGIDRPQRVVVEPVLGEEAFGHVDHHDVQVPRERPNQVRPALAAQVSDDGPLVPREQRPHPVRPVPVVVAAGRFDLDHVRAMVGEHRGDEGPRVEGGGVEHAQPAQRTAVDSGLAHWMAAVTDLVSPQLGIDSACRFPMPPHTVTITSCGDCATCTRSPCRRLSTSPES